jgi:hypothetical protein
VKPSRSDLEIDGEVLSAHGGETVVRAFETAGWRVRKCTWVDWEVRSDGAELVIEATEPPVFYGRIQRSASARETLAPLGAARVRWRAEVREEGGVVLARLESDGDRSE